MKILLLEDELMLNNAISEYLKILDIWLKVIQMGKEVLDNIDSSFDLLVLDINVPTKDGFEILTELNSKNLYTNNIYFSTY